MRLPNRLLWPVLVVTVLVHLPQLSCGYAYDDIEAILENPDLLRWDRAGALFQTNYWGSRNIGLYRPLVQLSYLVDGAGFGFDPRVSHGITLGLHLMVVALLFGFLVRLGLAPWTAAIAATIFGVQPGALGASVWISGRTDVLSALFCVAGLGLALRARDADEPMFGRATVGLGVCFLLGLLSKEMAVTLPILVLLLPGAGHHRRLPVLMIGFGIYLVLRMTAVQGVLPSFAGAGEGVVFQDRSVIERFALGVRACFRLLALLVLPIGLAADHRAHAWAQPDAELGGLSFLALTLWVVGLYFAWRRRRDALVPAYLVAATLLCLLPILQLIPIGAVMAERFNYMPALFLVPALVLLGRRLLAPLPAFLGPAALIAVAGYATVTVLRIPVYEDRGTYCRDVVRAYPEDHKAWNNLGVYWFLPDPDLDAHAADFTRADAAFEEALSHRPRYRKGLLNRSRALLERQRVADEKIALSPVETWLVDLAQSKDPDALYLLGKVSLRSHAQSPDPEVSKDHLESAWTRYEQAATEFRTRGAHSSRAAAAWKEAGLAARALRDPARQKSAWQRSLDLNPAIAGADAMRRFIQSADGSTER
ncbi:MAG: hypothetical protein CMJ83_12445 [Planctomycetes bacterium]|nr:hypothetical protein [Planctomycetota bacterium]